MKFIGRVDANQRKPIFLRLFLWFFRKTVAYGQKSVSAQSIAPSLGASLCVHGVLGGRQLVQQVECLDADDELALEEGLADGGIQHKVIGVQLTAAIAATGVHVAVG